MRELVLKARTASDREQCILDAPYVCEFSLGRGGDWCPEGSSGTELACIEHDGTTWWIRALTGSLRADGCPIHGRVELIAPAVVSLGETWLIVDDELEPDARTVELDQVLIKSALRCASDRTRRRRTPPTAAAFDDSDETTCVRYLPTDSSPSPQLSAQNAGQDDLTEVAPMPWIARIAPLEAEVPTTAMRVMEPEHEVTAIVDTPAVYQALAQVRGRPLLRLTRPIQDTPEYTPSLVPAVLSESSSERPSRAAWRWGALASSLSLVCVLGANHFASGKRIGQFLDNQARSLVAAAERRANPAPSHTAITAGTVVAPTADVRAPAPAHPIASDVALSTPMSGKDAADALIRGETKVALPAYRALSRAEPNNEAYSLIVSVLTRRELREKH